MKLNVGVIFGGRSLEHEMSIISAIQAMNNIDTDKYEITPIFIDKDNVWYTGGALRYIDTFKDLDLLRRYTHKINLLNKDGRYILQTTGLVKREIGEIHGGQTHRRAGHRPPTIARDGSLCRVVSVSPANTAPLFR